MLFRIVSFPGSGSEFFEAFLSLYFKNQIFRVEPGIDVLDRLEDWAGQDNCFIRTHRPPTSRKDSYNILLVSHPIIATCSFANFLANIKNWPNAKDLLEESLRPKFFPAASWVDLHRNWYEFADLVINIRDFYSRPMFFGSLIYQQNKDYLEKTDKKIFTSLLRSRYRPLPGVRSVSSFPKWYYKEIEDSCRVLYCDMGFDWSPGKSIKL